MLSDTPGLGKAMFNFGYFPEKDSDIIVVENSTRNEKNQLFLKSWAWGTLQKRRE